jgi:tripartite-type tricarboxylate transporter receptor subunit TctC
VRDALRTNAVRSGLTSQSFEVSDFNSQECDDQLKSDFVRWGAIAKETDFTAED